MHIVTKKDIEFLHKLYNNEFIYFLKRSFKVLHPNEDFIDNWYLELLAKHLDGARTGQVNRLLVNMPPRTLKSFTISVAWPAWLLGKDPSKKIIVASYNRELSDKLSQDCRTLIESEWYQKYFKKCIIKRGQNTKSKFVTTQEGFRFATSVSSTLTGEGADIIIIDDPQMPNHTLSESKRAQCINWYEQTLCSRLNDLQRGIIVMISQRLHPDDLSGHLLKKDTFEYVKLQAISEVDVRVEIGDFSHTIKKGDYLNENFEYAIARLKNEIGTHVFNAQYQQNPASYDTGLIKPNWINRYDDLNYTITYQSWDFAIKNGLYNDYSVCTTWAIENNKYYLLDVIRIKLEYPQLKKCVLDCYLRYHPNYVIMEDQASGEQLIQELRDSSMNIIKVRPKFKKLTRLALVSPMFESGKIYFPRDGPWLNDLQDELFTFPNTRHDDQVDSITQFLNYVSRQDIEYKLRYVD